jgi:hypothetical protein
MGRNRVPRRVGVRSDTDGRRLRFFGLDGATLDGGRVILSVPDPPVLVLPEGPG